MLLGLSLYGMFDSTSKIMLDRMVHFRAFSEKNQRKTKPFVLDLTLGARYTRG